MIKIWDETLLWAQRVRRKHLAIFINYEMREPFDLEENVLVKERIIAIIRSGMEKTNRFPSWCSITPLHYPRSSWKPMVWDLSPPVWEWCPR